MDEDTCRTCGKVIETDESSISIVPNMFVHLKCASPQVIMEAEDAVGLRRGALRRDVE